LKEREREREREREGEGRERDFERDLEGGEREREKVLLSNQMSHRVPTFSFRRNFTWKQSTSTSGSNAIK
jgi:hypothetical protein